MTEDGGAPERSLGDGQRQAVALFEAGRLLPALAAALELLERAPQRPDLMSFAGMITARLGEFAMAADLYRSAVLLKPDFVEAHFNLGNALDRLGDPAAAAAAYRRALALRPELPPALHNLGGVLRQLGQTRDAEAAYRRLLAIAPGAADTARDLGMLLEEEGRMDAAIETYRAGLAASPLSDPLRSHLVHAHMAKGEAGASAAICADWLAAKPGDLQALALQAVLLNETGDQAGARALLDFERFVSVTDLAAPPGYPSLAAFNAALVEHVRQHPTLKVPPRDHPTYHNDHLQITDELLAEPKGPMAALERLTRDAIERYIASVPRQPPHPYIAHWPARWTLTAWATLLEGQGNLDPHMHLEGYLSIVYYPAIPEAVRTGGDEAGWIELGPPPAALHCQAEPMVRRIQPKEGRLLLFPGYFFHGTRPFRAPERRISIAFDLVRAA